MSEIFEKILFLDVDGVLNTHLARWELGSSAIVPELTAILAEIVQATDAMIVVTSTWRTDGPSMAILLKALAEAGIESTLVVGLTPHIPITGRAEEINQWLLANPTKHFAILDDSPHAGHGVLAENFFWVSPIVGLQKSDAEAVIQHLNRN